MKKSTHQEFKWCPPRSSTTPQEVKWYPPQSSTTPQEGNCLAINSTFSDNTEFVNSPLEGCLKGGVETTETRLKGGVDSNNPIEDRPDWGKNSLFPYWTLPKNQKLKDRAKELRKQWILSEVLFWKHLKDKVVLGWDIDRQVIIGHYIVDFLIPELWLVFEINGSSHDDRVDYDEERNTFLEGLWLKVIHIPDIDVKKNMENIYDYVQKCISERKDYLGSNSNFMES